MIDDDVKGILPDPPDHSDRIDPLNPVNVSPLEPLKPSILERGRAYKIVFPESSDNFVKIRYEPFRYAGRRGNELYFRSDTKEAVLDISRVGEEPPYDRIYHWPADPQIRRKLELGGRSKRRQRTKKRYRFKKRQQSRKKHKSRRH